MASSEQLSPEASCFPSSVRGRSDVAAVMCRLSEAASADIARIELASNRPPWSERLFLNEFSNPCSLTFGARRDGELVAFVVAHAVIDEAHIVNFAVDQNARRRGIGRELLTYLLSDLYKRGVRWVTLEVRRSNQAALGLYEGMGFQEVGVRAGYYPDNQEDALVMSLNLSHFVANR